MMSQKTVNRDPIIEEIHGIRQQMSENFGGDIAAIMEDARRRQESSGRTIWQGPQANQPLGLTGKQPAE